MNTQNPELQQILLEVSRDLVANLALDELLPMILDQLARVVSYTSSSIMLLEGDVLRPVAQRTAVLEGVAAEHCLALGRSDQRALIEPSDGVALVAGRSFGRRNIGADSATGRKQGKQDQDRK